LQDGYNNSFCVGGVYLLGVVEDKMKEIRTYLVFMLGLGVLFVVGIMYFVWEGVYKCYQGLYGILRTLRHYA
jgi:hypothetical protein